ncbi:unnamed protein product [Adineta steineri]|uniref:Uncharacterized protein n=1 Tax=Adineta steineri TaxID=433720 RepID=A0A815H2A3_9BILA|nr:unnamed protein product [Adineta steineri]CAF1339540.1 unnamed protein product [Adineta steineri]CAF1348375.1 unnamed protein product [Adineta steineri]
MDDFDPSGSLALNQYDVETSPKRLIWCFWIFFLILLPLSSVVLIGFALFDSSITAYNEKGRIADILLMFTYVITIYGIIKIVLSITNSISIEHNTSVHTKKHSNIVFAFLFILGVGDSLFILTRFGDQLILIINQNFVPNSSCATNLALSMTANFLKSLCQLCILMFILHQLDHSIKFKRKESKIFLTCLSIFCLIQWAQILLQEVHFHKNKPDACDMALDQGLKRFDEIAPYLYPLGLEFRFASFIELLIMSECLGTSKKNILLKFYHWFSKNISCKGCSANRMFSTMSQCLKKMLSCFSVCFKKIKHPLGKNDILFPSILLPAIGTLLVSLSIVIVLFQEFNETDGDHRATVVHYDKNSLLTLISEICEIILLFVMSLYSICSLDKLCEKEKNFEQIPYVQTVNMEFIVDFAILLISNLFLNIYCCVTLAGSVISEAEEQLTQTIRWLTLTASVIPIIQTTLQLIIIWKVRRYNGMLTKGINQMWIILSFAIWLFDTFSAKAFDTNEIQISVYSGGWDILAALFVPMSLFFRFHSCIMFANIKDGAYWDEEDHSLA